MKAARPIPSVASMICFLLGCLPVLSYFGEFVKAAKKINQLRKIHFFSSLGFPLKQNIRNLKLTSSIYLKNFTQRSGPFFFRHLAPWINICWPSAPLAGAGNRNEAAPNPGHWENEMKTKPEVAINHVNLRCLENHQFR